jgi:hypothetical protein
MLLKNINLVNIALCVLLNTSSAQQVFLNKYDKTTCTGEGGDSRGYTKDICYNFYDSDHGIRMQLMDFGCTCKKPTVLLYDRWLTWLSNK